jgi:NAD-dependent aldehyde dehydrogenases
VVDKRLHDKVVEGVVERSKRLPMGDPLDPKMLVGPMASRKQYDKAVSYIRLGLAEGAKAAIGGIPRMRPRSSCRRRCWWAHRSTAAWRGRRSSGRCC